MVFPEFAESEAAMAGHDCDNANGHLAEDSLTLSFPANIVCLDSAFNTIYISLALTRFLRSRSSRLRQGECDRP